MKSPIPIIDMGPLFNGPTPGNKSAQAAAEIRHACENVGFFYIRNHKLSDNLRDQLFLQTRRFYDLPVDRKMEAYIGKSLQYRGYLPLGGEVTKERRDWHEAFDIGVNLRSDHPDVMRKKPLQGPNIWPTDVPELKATLSLAWDALFTTGCAVVRGLALSLNLDKDFFMPYIGKQPLCVLRLSHYPCFYGEEENVGDGIGEHIDYGFVTILTQDETGGLEVKSSDGTWISAPHIPGTCLVNIGHMVQRWTNDTYRATRHRVKIPVKKSRYSMPFFFDPAYETVVTPLDNCCSPENPSRYEPFHFGPYIANAFARSYAEHYG